MWSPRRLAIGAVLLMCLGGPIAETFDKWDHTLQDGNDTEINLVIVALCVGGALALTGIVVAGVRQVPAPRVALPPAYTPLASAWRANPIPNSRPPTALRI